MRIIILQINQFGQFVMWVSSVWQLNQCAAYYLGSNYPKKVAFHIAHSRISYVIGPNKWLIWTS